MADPEDNDEGLRDLEARRREARRAVEEGGGGESEGFDMSDTSTALVAEAERSAGGHVVIAPEKQYRRGGKRGRSSRKAPQLLRDLRWVYENPKREDATPAQMMLQKLLREK